MRMSERILSRPSAISLLREGRWSANSLKEEVRAGLNPTAIIGSNISCTSFLITDLTARARKLMQAKMAGSKAADRLFDGESF